MILKNALCRCVIELVLSLSHWFWGARRSFGELSLLRVTPGRLHERRSPVVCLAWGLGTDLPFLMWFGGIACVIMIILRWVSETLRESFMLTSVVMVALIIAIIIAGGAVASVVERVSRFFRGPPKQ